MEWDENKEYDFRNEEWWKGEEKKSVGPGRGAYVVCNAVSITVVCVWVCGRVGDEEEGLQH